MDKFRIIPLQNPNITLDESFQVSQAVQKEIDEFWEELKQKEPSYYDGKIFSITSLKNNSLHGHFIPYRNYVAWRQNEHLRSQFAIKPLSVSGITHTADKILIGKRSLTVMQYPGFYEFPPSGGIDEGCYKNGVVDHKGMIIQELLEETSITQIQIKSLKLFALLEDFSEGTVDLWYDIHIYDQVNLKSHEYDSLFFVSIDQIPKFFQEKNRLIMPPNLYLWDFYKGVQ